MIKCLHPIDKLASLLDEEGFEYEKTLIEEIKIIVPGWEDSGSTCRFVAKNGMIEIKEASAFFHQILTMNYPVLSPLNLSCKA